MNTSWLKKIGNIHHLCWGFSILLGCFFSNNTLSQEVSFLEHLKQTYSQADNVKKTEPATFMQKVLKDGSAIQTGTDKAMRSTFGFLQTQIEREMLNKLLKPKLDVSSKHIRSIWIIHTPLIATPLVTEGEASQNLVSAKVLVDKDKTRIQNALERSAVMREYLAKGGVLIATYVVDKREGLHGRTQEQIAIFEKLKQQYPQQLIELPIPLSLLSQGKFPADKLGATYITQAPSGHIFEMTNMGTQINDASDGAKWGVWLQERHLPKAQTTQRLCNVFHFLSQAGLKEILRQHAIAHRQKPQVYYTLLAPYLADKEIKGFAPNLLCGEWNENT